MSAQIQNLASYDPFADTGEGSLVGDGGSVIHVRLQQRNGRKTLTTVQGLDAFLTKEKIEKLIKHFKKEFCCNGTIVPHKEWGEVIQLQGDHRNKVQEILIANKICKKEQVQVHGF